MLYGVGTLALYLFNALVIGWLIEEREDSYGALGAAAALLFSMYLTGRLIVGVGGAQRGRPGPAYRRVAVERPSFGIREDSPAHVLCATTLGRGRCVAASSFRSPPWRSPPSSRRRTTAATRTLWPGVTYERGVQFTTRGPVAINILRGPRPGGLTTLEPVLSNETIVGRETLTSMQRRLAPGATAAGVNGDYFTLATGRPVAAS